MLNRLSKSAIIIPSFKPIFALFYQSPRSFEAFVNKIIYSLDFVYKILQIILLNCIGCLSKQRFIFLLCEFIFRRGNIFDLYATFLGFPTGITFPHFLTFPNFNLIHDLPMQDLPHILPISGHCIRQNANNLNNFARVFLLDCFDKRLNGTVPAGGQLCYDGSEHPEIPFVFGLALVDLDPALANNQPDLPLIEAHVPLVQHPVAQRGDISE